MEPYSLVRMTVEIINRCLFIFYFMLIIVQITGLLSKTNYKFGMPWSIV